MAEVLQWLTTRNRTALMATLQAGQFPVAHDVLDGEDPDALARVQWSIPHRSDPTDLYMVEQVHYWDFTQVLRCNCNRGTQIGAYRVGRRKIACVHMLVVLFFGLPAGVRQYVFDRDLQLHLAFLQGRARLVETAPDREPVNEYAALPF